MSATNTYSYIPVSEVAFYALLQDLEKLKLLDQFTFISQQGFIVIRFGEYGLVIEDRDEYQYSDATRQQWIQRVKGDK